MLYQRAKAKKTKPEKYISTHTHQNTGPWFAIDMFRCAHLTTSPIPEYVPSGAVCHRDLMTSGGIATVHVAIPANSERAGKILQKGSIKKKTDQCDKSRRCVERKKWCLLANNRQKHMNGTSPGCREGYFFHVVGQQKHIKGVLPGYR